MTSKQRSYLRNGFLVIENITKMALQKNIVLTGAEI